jgi:hypothetical protein
MQQQGQGQVLPECEVLAPQLTGQHQQMDGLLKEAAQQVCSYVRCYAMLGLM